MPGLLQRGVQLGHASATSFSASSGSAGSLSVSNTIWSKQREDLGYDQLRKFWYDLPTPARRELLRIDKQTLCEHARKNLYCSRCHGLLLECFSQIVMYGKSLQQEFVGEHCPQKTTADVFAENDLDNLQDASVHPWGGLATTKDGMLTLLDCFICASSPDVIYRVFNSARQREHDRELLFPDACGGGGRGWISHGLANFGRVHGARETCALHTSRLSCDTLLDFWSALGDETRSSLLHMKEDDFIERLMHRFDSKKFCRDCRRNVLREFKDLKELKRSRKELRCTNWFCAADTTILYEVSEDGVLVDWQHSFTETSTYHHFEWAIGTAEGKNDILDFEDVGMNRRAEVKGLNLSSLNACFITLRAWKLDGCCTELLVTAHALKGQACLHRSLAVADGFVTITKGDSSVRCFFRHAEKVEDEEEEDDDYDDSIDKDGDGSRPQRHAKSPELAREFLLDAATVIFKEQVEKAFREGTARQNSHSLFVSLAIKLLEDCVHVACKEIITLEKQMKLVEEEETEKRAEEERRERRKNKEREKKLRRKERLLKEKEKIIKDRELKLVEANPASNNDSPSPPSNNILLKSIDNGSLSTALNTLEPTSANTIEEEEEERMLLKGPQQAKSSSRRKLPFKRAALQNQAHRTTESSIKLKSSYRNASEYNNRPRDRFPISSTAKKLVCYSKRFFPNTNCAVVPKSKLVWEPISRADKETKYSSRNEAELSKKEEEEKPLPSAASPSSILIASSFDSSEGDNSRNEGASPSTSDSEDTCQPLDRRDASMGWARFSSDIPVHGIWPSPVGGGLPAFSLLRHSEGNSVQGHWVHGGNGREGAEPIKNCIGREEHAFSLFHSGGPFVRSAGKSQEGGVSCCSMEETRVEEYTLFAANNTSNRFLFSSFTL